MLQLRTINRALAARGIDFELVRGEGYFYVDGPGAERLPTASIYVFRLNDMSLERWIEAVAALAKEAAELVAAAPPPSPFMRIARAPE